MRRSFRWFPMQLDHSDQDDVVQTVPTAAPPAVASSCCSTDGPTSNCRAACMAAGFSVGFQREGADTHGADTQSFHQTVPSCPSRELDTPRVARNSFEFGPHVTCE